MIIVTGGRASGKTSAVIRWLLENPRQRAVLVGDESRRHHFLSVLKDGSKLGASYDWRPHVINASHYVLGGHMRGQRPAFHFPEIAIDDAEYTLACIFGVTLDFAAFNATWIPLSPPDDTVKAQVIKNYTIESAPKERLDGPPMTEWR